MTLAQLRNHLILGAAALAAAGLAAVPAQAALTISNSATKNVTCSAGVCAATAKNAVLNAGELANMLASGDVSVQSKSKAKDIELRVALSFVSASRLTLDAYRSITFDKPLTVAGSGALTLATDDGGSGGELSFVSPGRVAFWDLSSSLVIDGASYTLVGDIATLASDIAADPAGHYALADNYDASVDGTYATAPIPTQFSGTLNGLGNSISNLKIEDSTDSSVGLFEDITGTVQSLNLDTAGVAAIRQTVSAAAALAGTLEGSLFQVSVSGVVNAPGSSFAGGLVGFFPSTAIIRNCHASVAVSGLVNAGGLAGGGSGAVGDSYATGTIKGAYVGGLIGYFGFAGAGTLSSSFATGKEVSFYTNMANRTSAGGLVGANEGLIVNSFSTGNPLIKNPNAHHSSVGGLVGYNFSDGTIATSYSTGAPSPGNRGGTVVGGLIGTDDSSAGSLTDTYWDTTSSGITDLSQGAGNVANDSGISGLTTAQLQSGLPSGFSASVWGQSNNVNGGLPYLLSNPPP